MSETQVRISAEEARRLKADTAFTKFCNMVRDEQIRLFTESAADEAQKREEAHAILRALGKVEQTLDAAMTAERLLDRKQKGSAP